MKSLLLPLVLLPACAPARRHVSLLSERPASVDGLLRERPLAPGQAVMGVEVHRTREASFHIVQVGTAEKPHRHARHDLTGVVWRGRGTLHVDGVPRPVEEGSLFFVPRGAPHYFVNESTGPSAAWVTFTPPFDGKDVVPVEEP